MNAKAMCGEDYIRNGNWSAMVKSYKGWQQWADREAKKMSARDGFKWNGMVIYSEWRGCYRVSFGGQPEKV